MVWVITNVYHCDELLPYFLEYYRRKGVDKFLLLAHGSIPSVSNDIIWQPVNEPYKNGHRDNELLTHFKQLYLGANDWFLPVDLDEFVWLPEFKNVHSWCGDWDYVPGIFIDRIARDGRIHEIRKNESLDEQFPLAAPITRILCGGCPDKVSFARADVETSSGHHYASGRRAPFTAVVHHFKWGGKNFWAHMYHKQACYGYNEVSDFLYEYHSFGAINVFRADYGIHCAARIGI